MYSRYKDFVLDGIEYYGYTIISPDTDIIPLLKERDIKQFHNMQMEPGNQMQIS